MRASNKYEINLKFFIKLPTIIAMFVTNKTDNDVL